MNTDIIDTYDKFLRQKGKLHQLEAAPDHEARRKNIELLIERFRAALHEKGDFGAIGLFAAFSRSDENRSGELSINQFGIAIVEQGVNVSDDEITALYSAFEHEGHLHFREFMRVIVGEMPYNRVSQVELTWRKINPILAP